MGIKKNIIKENSYKDSVFLMETAGKLESSKGINAISLMMGTGANKEILAFSGLLVSEGETAGENDLIIAFDAEDEKAIDDALKKIETAFNTAGDTAENEDSLDAPTFETALKTLKNPNFALISVPGDYAAREAGRALDNNLNVMIFSDNVPVEDEVALKKKADSKDLLLMGPDCGTSIINGVPLGFANRVPSGNIGIAAASGSGLQELTVVIAKQGGGITQAIGAGGRDASLEVGGLTLLKGIEILKEDPNTEVIVLLSKPPHPEIAEKLVKKIKESGKPAVVSFLGSKDSQVKKEENISFISTIEGAAIAAVQISREEKIELPEFTVKDLNKLLEKDATKISDAAKYIRGLYAGGTLCDEAIDILKAKGISPYSNAGVEKELKLKDIEKSAGHTLIDMGEDDFTRGRPHPMIDLNLRNRRIEKEADDSETAVILFDLVLGYGAHADPAGAMKETLNKIKDKKILVASVCGTDGDPQNYSRQVAGLRECGVTVLPTNAQAARYACKVIEQIESR